MRITNLVALLLILPLTVWAEQRQNHGQSGRSGRSDAGQAGHAGQRPAGPPRPAQLPTTGLGPLGLPPIGLPPAHNVPRWEQNRLPSWEQKRVPAWEHPTTRPFNLNRIPGWSDGNVARAMLDQQKYRRQVQENGRGSRYLNNPGYVYVLPPYGYVSGSYVGYSSYVETPAAGVEPPPSMIGALHLEVEPRDLLQIFVDGLYIGTPADLGDAIELRAGARRIELRAPGYRTLIFDVEIMSDRLITYRGALEPSAPASPSTPPPSPKPSVNVPAGSKTMYLIPGCYMGNVSPKDVVLPAGCDIKKLVTITP